MNHALLHLDFGFGKGRVLRHVGDDIERAREIRRRRRDVIASHVIRGIRVALPANRLDFVVDFFFVAGFGAFKKRVLEQMRKSGAQKTVFVNRASFHVNSHRNNRRAAIFLRQNGESVGQSAFLHGLRIRDLRVCGRGRHDQREKKKETFHRIGEKIEPKTGKLSVVAKPENQRAKPPEMCQDLRRRLESRIAMPSKTPAPTATAIFQRSPGATGAELSETEFSSFFVDWTFAGASETGNATGNF